MKCPYCENEATAMKVGDDDFIDYCKECEVVLEGEKETFKPNPLMKFARGWQ
jgi:hypothetical protein